MSASGDTASGLRVPELLRGRSSERVSGTMGQVPRRMATGPSLAETLIGHDLHGRDDLEQAESEEEAPLLMLAAP